MIRGTDNYTNKQRLQRSVLYSLLITAGSSVPYYVHANTINNIQINALITQAIQTHPLVDSARADRRATTEGVNAAKLGLLPVPSVSTGYDRDNGTVSQVGLRQPLWTGGRLTASVNQALYDDKAAIENIYEQQNQVAKTTIDAWESYITAVASQRVSLKNLNQLADFEAMMQRRVGQGVSARIELDLVTNRILQEQNAFQAAQEQERIAAARLEQITGHPLSVGSAQTVPPLKALVDQAKVQSAEFERLAFSEASFYNPAVVREQFQVESAKQEVKVQKASQYPSVYAQYEQNYYHREDESEAKVFVGLNYEPGAGFSNFALTRASRARVDSLEQSQEAARRQVMEDIQVQYQQFVSAKSREKSLVAAVAGAQIVVNSYRRQFIAGRKSWLEVLNAVRELGDYETQLVQTRADILGNFYKLQVDFGLMPWQTFSNSRQPFKPFSVTDPVKEWVNKQQNEFIYTTDKADVPLTGIRKLGYGVGLVVPEVSTEDTGFDNTGYTGFSSPPIIQDDDTETEVWVTATPKNTNEKDATDSYVEVMLPESSRARLDNGEVIVISEDQIKGDYSLEELPLNQETVTEPVAPIIDNVNTNTEQDDLNEPVISLEEGIETVTSSYGKNSVVVDIAKPQNENVVTASNSDNELFEIEEVTLPLPVNSAINTAPKGDVVISVADSHTNVDMVSTESGDTIDINNIVITADEDNTETNRNNETIVENDIETEVIVVNSNIDNESNLNANNFISETNAQQESLELHPSTLVEVAEVAPLETDTINVVATNTNVDTQSIDAIPSLNDDAIRNQSAQTIAQVSDDLEDSVAIITTAYDDHIDNSSAPEVDIYNVDSGNDGYVEVLAPEPSINSAATVKADDKLAPDTGIYPIEPTTPSVDDETVTVSNISPNDETVVLAKMNAPTEQISDPLLVVEPIAGNSADDETVVVINNTDTKTNDQLVTGKTSNMSDELGTTGIASAIADEVITNTHKDAETVTIPAVAPSTLPSTTEGTRANTESVIDVADNLDSLVIPNNPDETNNIEDDVENEGENGFIGSDIDNYGAIDSGLSNDMAISAIPEVDDKVDLLDKVANVDDTNISDSTKDNSGSLYTYDNAIEHDQVEDVVVETNEIVKLPRDYFEISAKDLSKDFWVNRVDVSKEDAGVNEVYKASDNGETNRNALKAFTVYPTVALTSLDDVVQVKDWRAITRNNKSEDFIDDAIPPQPVTVLNPRNLKMQPSNQQLYITEELDTVLTNVLSSHSEDNADRAHKSDSTNINIQSSVSEDKGYLSDVPTHLEAPNVQSTNINDVDAIDSIQSTSKNMSTTQSGYQDILEASTIQNEKSNYGRALLANGVIASTNQTVQPNQTVKRMNIFERIIAFFKRI